MSKNDYFEIFDCSQEILPLTQPFEKAAYQVWVQGVDQEYINNIFMYCSTTIQGKIVIGKYKGLMK